MKYCLTFIVSFAATFFSSLALANDLAVEITTSPLLKDGMVFPNSVIHFKITNSSGRPQFCEEIALRDVVYETESGEEVLEYAYLKKTQIQNKSDAQVYMQDLFELEQLMAVHGSVQIKSFDKHQVAINCKPVELSEKFIYIEDDQSTCTGKGTFIIPYQIKESTGQLKLSGIPFEIKDLQNKRESKKLISNPYQNDILYLDWSNAELIIRRYTLNSKTGSLNLAQNIEPGVNVPSLSILADKAFSPKQGSDLIVTFLYQLLDLPEDVRNTIKPIQADSKYGYGIQHTGQEYVLSVIQIKFDNNGVIKKVFKAERLLYQPDVTGVYILENHDSKIKLGVLGEKMPLKFSTFLTLPLMPGHFDSAGKYIYPEGKSDGSGRNNTNKISLLAFDVNYKENGTIEFGKIDNNMSDFVNKLNYDSHTSNILDRQLKNFKFKLNPTDSSYTKVGNFIITPSSTGENNRANQVLVYLYQSENKTKIKINQNENSNFCNINRIFVHDELITANVYADSNWSDYISNKTKLMYAIENKDMYQVELYITQGADVHAQDHYGSSVFDYVIDNGDPQIAKAIISNGYDPFKTKNIDPITRSDVSDLAKALYHGRAEILKVILTLPEMNWDEKYMVVSFEKSELQTVRIEEKLQTFLEFAREYVLISNQFDEMRLDRLIKETVNLKQQISDKFKKRIISNEKIIETLKLAIKERNNTLQLIESLKK